MLGVNVKTPASYADSKPPPGYIPGVGRGAIGFTTRSDLGSAGVAPETAGRGAGAGAARGVAASSGIAALRKLSSQPAGEGKSGGEAADYSEANFDSFSGYSERLFGDAPYDEDDKEADRVYAEIDERMASRTAARKTAREAEDARMRRMTESRIGDAFADLKPALAALKSEDWDAIPEIGDRSLRFKKRGPDLVTPVPDALIESGRAALAGDRGLASSVAPGSIPASLGGGSGGGDATDVLGMSRGRTQMLSMRLDRMGDSVTGQTTVDPKGYLTSLAAASAGSLSETSDVEDVRKARLLMKSVVTTNPRHGPGWVALARLEEAVRNLSEARRVARQGCEMCPEDEDVWLEAARLQTPANARLVLADAVKTLPTSVKLWLRAADAEDSDPDARRAVLRKALTLVPGSERLWRAAISLETPADARVMLARAVECVPTSLDMWLALAKLEDYAGAQRVLNAARAALPSEPLVWISAAKLEEAQGHADTVERIIARALKSLTASQALVDRDAWVRHAEDAERADAPLTAAAIVRLTGDVGVEAADRRRTWLADAAALEERGSIVCARAMYARALAAFPTIPSIWQRAAELEKKHGGPGAADALYRRAVAHCPGAETLWLMAAKDAWLGGRVDDARGVLREAYAANPTSEAVLLAAVKLEWESDEVVRARALLARARSSAPSARVWLKSAALEREAGDAAAEAALLAEGTTRFPTAPKLWMMYGQLREREGDRARAREIYGAGLRACPTSMPLWRLAARVDEALGGAVRARSTLEAARHKLPQSAELWIESVRLERRHGGDKVADALLARALQECPSAGALWAEAIATAPRPAQKRTSIDALQRCDNDPAVVLAVARLFAADRKLDKARKWFDRATTLDADAGDAWAAWLAFEHANGDADAVAEVERRCVAAEPRHGEAWTAVSKALENRRLRTLDVLRRVAGVPAGGPGPATAAAVRRPALEQAATPLPSSVVAASSGAGSAVDRAALPVSAPSLQPAVAGVKRPRE